MAKICAFLFCLQARVFNSNASQHSSRVICFKSNNPVIEQQNNIKGIFKSKDYPAALSMAYDRNSKIGYGKNFHFEEHKGSSHGEEAQGNKIPVNLLSWY